MPESHMPEAPLPGSTMLEGKVALVSGIGPGMGRDVSLLLARHGADVVLGARRTEKSEEVAAEVRALGRRAEVVALDITDADACAAAVAPGRRRARRARHPRQQRLPGRQPQGASWTRRWRSGG